MTCSRRLKFHWTSMHGSVSFAHLGLLLASDGKVSSDSLY
jgi:hypothetical protein